MALILTVAMPAFANNGNDKAVGKPHDTPRTYDMYETDRDGDDEDEMTNLDRSFDKNTAKEKIKDWYDRDQDQDQDRDQDRDRDQDEEDAIHNRIMVQENYFTGLPYGLSKRTLLPYGLSKREVLPFGLDKKLWGYEADLDEISIEALIESLNDLLEEADETITLFAGLEYDVEITALENAMTEAKEAISTEDVTAETLKEAFMTLNHAIKTFDTLEVMDENAATLLNAQIDSIEATLNASIYGEVQGAFPVDADNDLLETIKDVKSKISEPMTHSEFITLSQSLQREFKQFIAMQYATKDEIVVYNTTVSSYKVEVTEWFTTGNVADTAIQVLSENFMDYYRITYLTPVFAEDALEVKRILDERIRIITLSRATLLEE